MGWMILGWVYLLAGQGALVWLLMTSCHQDWDAVDSPS